MLIEVSIVYILRSAVGLREKPVNPVRPGREQPQTDYFCDADTAATFRALGIHVLSGACKKIQAA